MEDVGLTLDILDVGMAGDDPERLEPVQLRLVERRGGADLAEGLIHQLALRIGLGIDDRLRKFDGQCHGVSVLC